jgi:hypothetical protein
MSRQPEWRLFKSLGDLGEIYEDQTGQYEPEVELWEAYETERGKTRFLVHRFSLERKSLYKGRIIPFGFHKRADLPHPIGQYEEWYSKDLGSVASSAGTTKARLARDLTSADPLRRFWAYYAIGGHYGFDNFDSDPLDLSEKEFEKRTA